MTVDLLKLSIKSLLVNTSIAKLGFSQTDEFCQSVIATVSESNNLLL